MVIPPSIGAEEMARIESRLAAIDADRCAATRQQAYDELLVWIDEIARQPEEDHFLRVDDMHAFVVDHRNLERATLPEGCGGCDKATCPPGTAESSESVEGGDRPISRATVFSLATASSASFWLTLGVLAIWRLRREHDREGPSDDPQAVDTATPD